MSDPSFPALTPEAFAAHQARRAAGEAMIAKKEAALASAEAALARAQERLADTEAELELSLATEVAEPNSPDA
jgi:hypothetical protein